MKKTSSRIEKMLILIQMRFMKYETRRFSETHSLKRKRRLQQKKIDTNEVLTCRSFFSTSSKFLSVIVETVELFQKGMENLLRSRVQRETPYRYLLLIANIIAERIYYRRPSLFEVLVFEVCTIRGSENRGKLPITRKKSTVLNYFRPKLLVLVFVGSKFLRFVTLANSEGNLYELQRKSKVR